LLLAITQVEISAQIKPLKIGERCPDVLIKNILGHDSSQLKLSFFKNKFLILDFWSTSCVSCVAAMPKIDSLQSLHGDQLQVLLVTNQKTEVIEKFWKARKLIKDLSLIRVTEDRILEKYFPHEGVPHIVWIDANRVVRAITGGEYISKKNVETILNGGKVNWMVKEKRDYDFNQPLFQLKYEISDAKILYYSGVTGYLPGASSPWRFQTDSVKAFVRLLAINQSIPELYRYALNYSSTKGLIKRFRLELEDSSKYFYKKNWGYAAAWRNQNSYCYEAILPLNTSREKVYSCMIDDLNKYFRLDGRMEKKCTDVLILIKKPVSNDVMINPDTPVLKKYSTSLFVSYLDKIDGLPTVIDSTGGKEMINFKLNLSSWTNIPELRAALQRNGFDLVPAQREIDLFILTEIGSAKENATNKLFKQDNSHTLLKEDQ